MSSEINKRRTFMDATYFLRRRRHVLNKINRIIFEEKRSYVSNAI